MNSVSSASVFQAFQILSQTANIAVFRTRRETLLLGSYHKCLPNNVLRKGIPIEQVNAALALSRSGTSVLDSVIILKF